MSRSTDASVAFSVKDNLSESVVKMKNTLGGFRDDIEGLQAQLDLLQRTKVQLKQVDLKNAKAQVEEMRKALQELGDSASEADRKTAQANFDEAVQNYNNVANQLDLVSKQARQTQRDILNVSDAVSKADNQTSGRAGGASGLLSAIGKAGLLDMAGDVALDLGNYAIGSELGSEIGGMVSSGLSGAISGAAMGSLAGPVGTAIGAAVGGGLGLVQGATQALQGRDEAFKSYYSGLYEQGQESSAETLSGGSSVAAQRELDAIAFDRLLHGQGDTFLEGLRETAAKTPFEYDDLTTMARNLATGFGTDPDRMLKLMEAIGDAGAAVGASTADMQWMATALSRMQSTDLAQLGEINMFQDRGVDVIGMLAEALGVSEGDVRSMISGGEIGDRQAVDIIQAGLTDADGVYAGSMTLMSETFDGLTSTLSDAMTEIQNARGEGYNAVASEGLQADIESYGGALGDALAQANEIIGEGQAIAENLSRQYNREALEAVTLGTDTTVYDEEQAAKLQDLHAQYTDLVDQYQTATEEDKAVIAAQIDALMQEAEDMAESANDASDMSQQLHDVNLDLIEAIRENTAAYKNSPWLQDYEVQQELSKGQGAAAEDYSMMGDWSSGTIGSNAAGLNRVPYNNYLTYLHEGERVLTASQAREMDRGGNRGISVTVSGNTFGAGMDAEEVAEAIAGAIAQKLQAGFAD